MKSFSFIKKKVELLLHSIFLKISFLYLSLEIKPVYRKRLFVIWTKIFITEPFFKRVNYLTLEFSKKTPTRTTTVTTKTSGNFTEGSISRLITCLLFFLLATNINVPIITKL